PVVVINRVMVMPIETPMTPAPSKTAEVSDSEADTEGEVRTCIPNSGIRIPSRPRHYGISVNDPRIIRGDINHVRAGGLNDDRGILRGYGLLRRTLQIASFFRFLAHYLHGIHHVLLLVVVSVAQRWRPGEGLVHIDEAG